MKKALVFLLTFVIVLSSSSVFAYAKYTWEYEEYTPTKSQMKKKYPWELKVLKRKKFTNNIDYDNFKLKFKDVPKDSKYYKAVVWHVVNGNLKNEEINFSPDKVATSRDLALYLTNTIIAPRYSKREIISTYNLRPERFNLDDPLVYLKVYAGVNQSIHKIVSYEKVDRYYYPLKEVRSLNSKVNGFSILCFAAILNDIGISSLYADNLGSGGIRHPADSWDLIYQNIEKVMKYYPHKHSFMDGKNKKDIAKALKDRFGDRFTGQITNGAFEFQRIGLLPKYYSIEDLNLGKLYTKGEIAEITYQLFSKFRGHSGKNILTEIDFFTK